MKFFVFFLAFLTACLPSHDQRSVHDEIVAIEQAYMAAFQEGNAFGMAALYSKEAQLLPSNRDFVEGRQAISKFWQGLMRLGIKTIKLETIEVKHDGQQAVEIGRYTIHNADSMIDFGKYLVVWKRREADWLIDRHIWTTSMLKAHESRI